MIGNVRQWYRKHREISYLDSNYEIKVDQETLEKSRVCTGVSTIKTGYSIRFSAKNADELHKLCLDSPSEYSNNMTTSYIVQRGENKGPTSLVTVRSFKDCRDAEDIEEPLPVWEDRKSCCKTTSGRRKSWKGNCRSL